MGPRDEELVRTAFEHWNHSDWEAALRYVDPDVEWRTSAPLVDLPSLSRGHDGVRAFWQSWATSWTSIRPDAEEFIPAGDELLVLVRWRHQPGRDRGRPASRISLPDPRRPRDPLHLLLGAGRRVRGTRPTRSRLTANWALPLHAERP